MTNAMYLCGGTAWDDDGAFLRLSQPGGRSTLRLGPGTELRFRIRSEAPRYCLGYEPLSPARAMLRPSGVTSAGGASSRTRDGWYTTATAAANCRPA